MIILFLLQYDGELYILATDQGYINQPDLVWEKLNEVKLSVLAPGYGTCKDRMHRHCFLLCKHTI